MKPGDIVRLKEKLYPQYKGKVGVLIQSQDSCVVGQAEYWAENYDVICFLSVHSIALYAVKQMKLQLILRK